MSAGLGCVRSESSVWGGKAAEVDVPKEWGVPTPATYESSADADKSSWEEIRGDANRLPILSDL